MTATIVDKSTCSKCGSEPRCGKSSWGRACLNGAAKDARERRKAGLPTRPRGRPKKSAQNGSTESTEPIHAAAKKVAQNGATERREPIHAAVVTEIARRQVIREAEASVALDNEPDMHACHEEHCAPSPERTERTPGHGAWCAGMCCRVAPQG